MDFVITSFEWDHSQCKFHIWLFDFYLFFSTLRKDIYLINRMNLIENGKINAYNLHKQINWKVNCSCWKRHVLLLFFSLETMWFHFFLICNLSLNSPDCELHQLFTQQLQMQLNEIETEKTIHTSTSIDDHRFWMRYDVKMFPWNQINIHHRMYCIVASRPFSHTYDSLTVYALKFSQVSSRKTSFE